jgi:hypothetical protein
VTDLDGNPVTRVTGLGCPVTLVSGFPSTPTLSPRVTGFFLFFLYFLVGDIFLRKNEKKLCLLSVFSLFLSLFLSFSVHTVWVLFSLINFTNVNREG